MPQQQPSPAPRHRTTAKQVRRGLERVAPECVTPSGPGCAARLSRGARAAPPSRPAAARGQCLRPGCGRQRPTRARRVRRAGHGRRRLRAAARPRRGRRAPPTSCEARWAAGTGVSGSQRSSGSALACQTSWPHCQSTGTHGCTRHSRRGRCALCCRRSRSCRPTCRRWLPRRVCVRVAASGRCPVRGTPRAGRPLQAWRWRGSVPRRR
mmetsp:Transcript_137646/g.383936  ORF Transcript_137646/g.383936 Transcript_137646/m.383936 type:complete len:209 (-) Transcript_137646:442-1068(-)